MDDSSSNLRVYPTVTESNFIEIIIVLQFLQTPLLNTTSQVTNLNSV